MEAPAKKFVLFMLVALGAVTVIFISAVRTSRSITTKNQPTPLLAANAVDIPSYATDPSFGNPGADITITEFIDMGNPTSRTLHKTLYHFAQAHPTKVRLIWKDLPQKHLFSGDSTLAHRAGACAQVQNKFWDFTEELFSRKTNLNEHDLTAVAETTKLNVPTWLSCVHSAESAATVSANAALAPFLGITNPPALYINNKRLNTEKDIDYRQLLDSLITP